MRRWPTGLVALALLAVPACGDGEKPPPKVLAPPPTPVPPVTTDVPAGVPASVTFSEIMIAYQRPGGVAGVTRSRDEAWELARTVLRRIQEGESFGLLLDKYTDNRGDDGKPFNEGSYSKAWKDPRLNGAIKEVVFRLPVNAVAPDPVDSGFAWHVLRRDA